VGLVLSDPLALFPQ